MLFAKKHDGTKRMCVDCRRLNDLTQKVVYPLPRIDECTDHLRDAMVFTKMDLRSGFHQILVFHEHKERTAFHTRPRCMLATSKRAPAGEAKQKTPDPPGSQPPRVATPMALAKKPQNSIVGAEKRHVESFAKKNSFSSLAKTNAKCWAWSSMVLEWTTISSI